VFERSAAPSVARPAGAPAIHPSYVSECDPPQDTIRIRLACELLRAVGRFFCAGEYRPLLESYLTRLQRYALAKVRRATFVS